MSPSEHIDPNIDSSWKHKLLNEFQQDYFRHLKQFLVEEKKTHQIYPPGTEIFEAFNQTPFDEVKVVILGQDPYHGKGQAHGLCFSVNKGIKVPPSLVNIYKELKQDLNLEIPTHGYLKSWAQQGVLLLNATLTVRANQAGSHQKKGWEYFTNSVIKTLSEEREKLVFLLWGNYAKAKEELINTNKHLVLKAAHPSPFSAYSGFFGCQHFSRSNQYLKDQGLSTINWQIV